MVCFHGAFTTGVACQQGTLTLPDTWFRGVPPFWDLLVLQLLRSDSSNLLGLYSTFHLEYPLVPILSRFCLSYIGTYTCRTYKYNEPVRLSDKIVQAIFSKQVKTALWNKKNCNYNLVINYIVICIGTDIGHHQMGRWVRRRETWAWARWPRPSSRRPPPTSPRLTASSACPWSLRVSASRQRTSYTSSTPPRSPWPRARSRPTRPLYRTCRPSHWHPGPSPYLSTLPRSW